MVADGGLPKVEAGGEVADTDRFGGRRQDVDDLDAVGSPSAL